MATPTKIVVYFDDGTSTEIPVRGMSSVFLRENAAVKCGHRPPYKQGPPPNENSAQSMTGTMTLMATADDDGDNGDDSASGESCYWINGVIVCP